MARRHRCVSLTLEVGWSHLHTSSDACTAIVMLVEKLEAIASHCMAAPLQQPDHTAHAPYASGTCDPSLERALRVLVKSTARLQKAQPIALHACLQRSLVAHIRLLSSPNQCIPPSVKEHALDFIT